MLPRLYYAPARGGDSLWNNYPSITSGDPTVESTGAGDNLAATLFEAMAQVVAAAKERLASQLDTSTEVVDTIAVEPVERSKASLSGPKPGKMSALVITPGYRVLLEVEDEQFEVHTDREGRIAVL